MKRKFEPLFVKYLLRLMRVAFGGSFVMLNLHDYYYFMAYSGGMKKNLYELALASELYRIHRSTFIDGDICDLCDRVEKGKKI